MSEHDLSEDLLSAYLDDELDGPTRRAIEGRLAIDPDWAALLAELAEVRAAVRSLPLATAPLGFWDRAHGYVASDGAAPARASRWSGRRAARRLAGGAAAAAVVGAFLLTQPVDAPGSDDPVAPAIPALADSHAVTAALRSDPLSELAPVAVQTPIGP
jgi:anti-sigma factor RsiW